MNIEAMLSLEKVANGCLLSPNIFTQCICWFVAAIQRSAALVLIMAYPQSIRKYVYCVSWRRERDSQEDAIGQKADKRRCDRTINAIEQPVKQGSEANYASLG